MSRKIEVTETEYIALMIARNLKDGFASGGFVGVDEASKEGDLGSVSVMNSQKLELEKKLELLKDRKLKLHHYLQFIENHDLHDVTIHSYTEQEQFEDGKGVTFEGQFGEHGMKGLVEYLMSTVEEDIKTTKEMLAPILRIEKSIQDKLGGN